LSNSRESGGDAWQELQQQNQELLDALEMLRVREEELAQRRAEISRLNQ
jgi:hypothetical protein